MPARCQVKRDRVETWECRLGPASCRVRSRDVGARATLVVRFAIFRRTTGGAARARAAALVTMSTMWASTALVLPILRAAHTAATRRNVTCAPLANAMSAPAEPATTRLRAPPTPPAAAATATRTTQASERVRCSITRSPASVASPELRNHVLQLRHRGLRSRGPAHVDGVDGLPLRRGETRKLNAIGDLRSRPAGVDPATTSCEASRFANAGGAKRTRRGGLRVAQSAAAAPTASGYGTERLRSRIGV